MYRIFLMHSNKASTLPSFPPSLVLLSNEHIHNAKCIQHRQYDFGFLQNLEKALFFKVQSGLFRLCCWDESHALILKHLLLE